MAGAPVLGAIFSEYLFGDRLGTFVNWNPWGVYLMIFSIVGSLIMTTLPQGPGKVKYGNFKPMIGILVAFFIIGMVTRILITEGTTFFAS